MSDWSEVGHYVVPSFVKKCDECDEVLCEEHYYGHRCDYKTVQITVEVGPYDHRFFDLDLCDDCHEKLLSGDLSISLKN